MTIRDNLIAAKELISDPAKWGRGAGPHEDGTMCVLEAVRVATTKRPVAYADLSEWKLLAKALPDGDYKTAKFVGGYNDNPSTTHADIMALLDRAIALS